MVQLNKMICKQILRDDKFLEENTETHALTISSDEWIPTQVDKGQKSQRLDLTSKFEEADNIIVQQVVSIRMNSNECVITLADDTDVFALLWVGG